MLVNELLAPPSVSVTVAIIEWVTFQHLLGAGAGSGVETHHGDEVTDEDTVWMKLTGRLLVSTCTVCTSWIDSSGFHSVLLF